MPDDNGLFATSLAWMPILARKRLVRTKAIVSKI